MKVVWQHPMLPNMTPYTVWLCSKNIHQVTGTRYNLSWHHLGLTACSEDLITICHMMRGHPSSRGSMKLLIPFWYPRNISDGSRGQVFASAFLFWGFTPLIWSNFPPGLWVYHKLSLMGWVGNEGVDISWDMSPVSNPFSVLSHHGEFNKLKSWIQICAIVRFVV